MEHRGEMEIEKSVDETKPVYERSLDYDDIDGEGEVCICTFLLFSHFLFLLFSGLFCVVCLRLVVGTILNRIIYYLRFLLLYAC